MFIWEAVQNLLESHSWVQGDSHPTSAICRELGTVLRTAKGEAEMPATNSKSNHSYYKGGLQSREHYRGGSISRENYKVGLVSH